MMKAAKVKITVGGNEYAVPSAVLKKYPDSVLAKEISEQLEKDPKSKIVFERDGVIFRHVLMYLRDGKVVLPASVPKGKLLTELSFYGVQANSMDIDDSKSLIEARDEQQDDRDVGERISSMTGIAGVPL